MIVESCWISAILQVREGEAMALLSALEWVEQLGMTNVIFEMDGKVVLDNILQSSDEQTEFGSIINHCKELLQRNSTCSISFIRRTANGDTHLLA